MFSARGFAHSFSGTTAPSASPHPQDPRTAPSLSPHAGAARRVRILRRLDRFFWASRRPGLTPVLVCWRCRTSDRVAYTAAVSCLTALEGKVQDQGADSGFLRRPLRSSSRGRLSPRHRSSSLRAVCPNLLFRNGHQAYGIRTHPRGPMLTQLSPQRPDPQIQLYSEVLGVRASNTKLGDTQFIPHQGLSRRSQQHASFSEKPVLWKDPHPAARSGSSSIWQHLALPASVSAPISPTFS